MAWLASTHLPDEPAREEDCDVVDRLADPAEGSPPFPNVCRSPPPRPRAAGLGRRLPPGRPLPARGPHRCRPIPSRPPSLYDGGLLRPVLSTQYRQYVKHITITNNSPETIYPFLEDANNRTATPGDPTPAPTYTGTGMFDPFDPLNHEYRGYIGYTQQVNGQTVDLHGPAARATPSRSMSRWSSGMPAASSSRRTVPTCWERGAMATRSSTVTRAPR